MTDPDFRAALHTESAAFLAVTDTPFDVDPGDDFVEEIHAVYSQSVPGRSLADLQADLKVMHGFLERAYISGWAEPGDPPWSKSRASSWSRWVMYLVEVRGLEWRAARQEAKTIFEAVDSVSPYS